METEHLVSSAGLCFERLEYLDLFSVATTSGTSAFST